MALHLLWSPPFSTGLVPFTWLFQCTVKLSIPSVHMLSLLLANFKVHLGQICLIVIELFKWAIYYCVNTSISDTPHTHMGVSCCCLPNPLIKCVSSGNSVFWNVRISFLYMRFLFCTVGTKKCILFRSIDTFHTL